MRSTRCWRARLRQRQRAIARWGVCLGFAFGFALIPARAMGGQVELTSGARALCRCAEASQAQVPAKSRGPAAALDQSPAEARVVEARTKARETDLTEARGEALPRVSSEALAEARAEGALEKGGRVHVESRPRAIPSLNCSQTLVDGDDARCAAEPSNPGGGPAAGRDANRWPVFGEATQAVLPEARENLATQEVGLCGTCPAKSAIQPWPWEAVFNPICAVDEMILTEPEGGLSTPIQHLVYGGIATLVPALGLRLGQGASRSRLSLSWPWSLPLGPVMASTREEGPCQERVFEMRPLRLLLEPSLAFTSPVTFAVRPGVQAMFQRANWNVGLGAGLGSTVETTGPHGLRASLSPEILLNWGRCCGPGFLRLALRYDLFFSGRERHAFSTHVGFSFY